MPLISYDALARVSTSKCITSEWRRPKALMVAIAASVTDSSPRTRGGNAHAERFAYDGRDLLTDDRSPLEKLVCTGGGRHLSPCRVDPRSVSFQFPKRRESNL